MSEYVHPIASLQEWGNVCQLNRIIDHSRTQYCCFFVRPCAIYENDLWSEILVPVLLLTSYVNLIKLTLPFCDRNFKNRDIHSVYLV